MIFIGKRRVERWSLPTRILLSPIRVAIFLAVVLPAILLEAAGEDGMKILDFIWEIGNE